MTFKGPRLAATVDVPPLQAKSTGTPLTTTREEMYSNLCCPRLRHDGHVVGRDVQVGVEDGEVLQDVVDLPVGLEGNRLAGDEAVYHCGVTIVRSCAAEGRSAASVSSGRDVWDGMSRESRCGRGPVLNHGKERDREREAEQDGEEDGIRGVGKESGRQGAVDEVKDEVREQSSMEQDGERGGGGGGGDREVESERKGDEDRGRGGNGKRRETVRG